MDFKSGFINKQPQTPPKENSENRNLNIVYLLQSKQYAEAYLILKDALAKEKTVFALFNISLCLLKANKHADAATCLEEALNLCKKDIGSMSETRDFVVTELEKAELSSDSYQAPMSEITPVKHTQSAKIKIIRLLADAYLQSQNWQKLNGITSNPNYIKYENIKKAFETSKSNS